MLQPPLTIYIVLYCPVIVIYDFLNNSIPLICSMMKWQPELIVIHYHLDLVAVILHNGIMPKMNEKRHTQIYKKNQCK